VADEDEQTLAEAFWSVARRLRRLSREGMAQWDINPSHARALAVLGRHGTMRLSELSDHLHIAPRSTTEVVDALEERGLVSRQPDPSDRRATLISVTPEGDHVIQAVWSTRSAEVEAIFGSLSATDRAALGRILRKLQD
jgi:DNA-binding MarR family transcriptional regulator